MKSRSTRGRMHKKGVGPASLGPAPTIQKEPRRGSVAMRFSGELEVCVPFRRLACLASQRFADHQRSAWILSKQDRPFGFRSLSSLDRWFAFGIGFAFGTARRPAPPWRARSRLQADVSFLLLGVAAQQPAGPKTVPQAISINAGVSTATG
jgi:hypothetical protein